VNREYSLTDASRRRRTMRYSASSRSTIRGAPRIDFNDCPRTVYPGRVKPMKYALLASIVFATVSMLPGCGSSTSSGPSADSACTQIAGARCERIGICSMDAVKVRFGDVATCEAAEKAACMNSLASTSTAATPATTIACAGALPSVDCADYNDNILPTACQSPAGKVASGGTCAFNAQCQSQFCGIDKNALCGVCQTQPKLNDSCANLTNCGPGLECVNKGAVCASEATKLGDMCSAAAPCGSGFSCVGAKAATATVAAVDGTCQQAVQTAGPACDSKRKSGASCDSTKGLACDATGLTCIAIVVASAGQPCDGNLTVCSSAATCMIPTGATAGTCIAAAADGAACDTANGPNCLALSRCIVSGTGTSGTCEIPADKCTAGIPSGAAGGSGTSGAGGATGSIGDAGAGGIAPI
jgi:hypothetical protein